MKKIVFFLGLFCFISLVGNAQNDFRFGLHLSPSINWMTTNDNEINSNGSNIGLRLGFSGEYFFADRYAVTASLGFAFGQGGTLLHNQGGNFWTQSDLSNPELNDSENALPNGTNLKYRIQYIEIPIGLKMRTDEIGHFRYYGEPILAFGFRTQARGDVMDADGLNTEKEDIKADVNFLNLLWGVGAGIEYSINGSTTFVGGIQYSQGFLDVTDNSAVKNDGSREDSNAVTRSITLRLGVMF